MRKGAFSARVRKERRASLRDPITHSAAEQLVAAPGLHSDFAGQNAPRAVRASGSTIPDASMMPIAWRLQHIERAQTGCRCNNIRDAIDER